MCLVANVPQFAIQKEERLDGRILTGNIPPAQEREETEPASVEDAGMQETAAEWEKDADPIKPLRNRKPVHGLIRCGAFRHQPLKLRRDLGIVELGQISAQVDAQTHGVQPARLLAAKPSYTSLHDPIILHHGPDAGS